MQFKDYYATLGVEPGATQDEIKRAYRKLARRYHPDVSKEPDAEARFKEVAEANEALSDDQRRAAYDEAQRRHERGQEFASAGAGGTPGGGFNFGARGSFDEAADFSEFFESIFGRGARAAGGGAPGMRVQGDDQHAKVLIDLEDSYRGARRAISLRMPVRDSHGRSSMQERTLDVNIPKGVREGQHLRLAGQGTPGIGGANAGDLYLEIAFRPHPRFRLDGRDVYVDVPVAPWEAALGANVPVPTPEGDVSLAIPAGTRPGRKLRLRGRGLPGNPAGDLYAVIGIALPKAESAAARAAYQSMAEAFAGFDPRRASEV